LKKEETKAMTLIRFLKILSINLKTIIFFSFLAGSIVFFLTKDSKKEFTSKTTISTGVVSGYNLENHNSDSRVDRDYTRNEIENLINLATAYETIEDLSIYLIANYLHVSRDDNEWIDNEGYHEINALFVGELSRQVICDTSVEETIKKIEKINDSKKTLSLTRLIYSDHPFFGVDQLAKIKVRRKGASDLLEFTYSTSNPVICMQTLNLLTSIFLKKHKLLKENQSQNVLKFFELATQESKRRLGIAEENLLVFREENNIINYYEQTRFIADKKEDLEELIFKEKMELQGALSSLEKLDSQLESRGVLADLNASMLQNRDRISSLTGKLALLAIKDTATVSEEIQKTALKEELAMIEKEINAKTREIYKAQYSTEGLSADKLLTKWLTKLIQIETSKSKLDVLQVRKKEFEKIYAQFAPWGSKLKKIEREIALAEDAYLENLHSFNQARLHLQNTISALNLGVLDAPFLPVKDNGSKRSLLLILAFVAGGFLTLSLFVLTEFLDQTLRAPINASKQTGITLLGALPLLPNMVKYSNPNHINFPKLKNTATELLYQSLQVQGKKDNEFPKTVVVSSMKSGEGVTFVSNVITQRLRKDLKRVLCVRPQNINAKRGSKDRDTIVYSEQTLFGTYETMTEWIRSISEEINISDYDQIVVETAPLLSGKYPLNLLNDKMMFLLVARANRVWNSADKNQLRTLKNLIKLKPLLVLNAVKLDHLEEFIGDIPKPRGKVRKLFKQVATFNFSGKTSI